MLERKLWQKKFYKMCFWWRISSQDGIEKKVMKWKKTIKVSKFGSDLIFFNKTVPNIDIYFKQTDQKAAECDQNHNYNCCKIGHT